MRSFRSVGDERDRSAFCGLRGGRWGPLPGRSPGESHHLQGGAAERTPLRRVLAASRRRSLSLRRRREAIPRTRGAYVVRGGPLAEGMTPDRSPVG